MKQLVKYQRSICSVALVMLTSLSLSLSAETNIIPEPFRGQDENSTITIRYDDYSEILKMSVLDMGKSTRAKAPKTTAKIGSRFKAKRKAYTAMEGNRFIFKNFTINENKDVLTTIRKSLEHVPDEVPMSRLNTKEQLAFWLNLYNLTLIEQLVDIYPQKNIEDKLYDRDGILNKKILNVSGIKLSLNDINKKIIFGKFGNSPVVIYGLFQGTIGGPNIRKTAYTGKLVVNQLRHNAIEFINSNRGTFKGDKGILNVSSFYEQNSQFFTNFDIDLKEHLATFIDVDYSQNLENATKIRANIKDMSIADLTGGQREFASSSANNEAAFLDSISGTSSLDSNSERTGITGTATANVGVLSSRMATDFVKNYGRFSPDTVEMLIKMKAKENENKGKIIIKEDGS